MRLIIADIKRKKRIFEQDGSSAGMVRVIMADGTSANVLFRVASCLNRWRLSPIAFLVQWINKCINGCVIGVGAQFGPGLVLMHPVGVIVNSKVNAGTNITLESGVVLGDEKGHSPRLGDDIFIGAGAKVFGDVDIGSNVKIGANAVVTKSAPDGATMLGIPARPN